MSADLSQEAAPAEDRGLPGPLVAVQALGWSQPGTSNSTPPSGRMLRVALPWLDKQVAVEAARGARQQIVDELTKLGVDVDSGWMHELR